MKNIDPLNRDGLREIKQVAWVGELKKRSSEKILNEGKYKWYSSKKIETF